MWFSFPGFLDTKCKHFSALSHSSQGHPVCKSEYVIEGMNPAHLKDVFLMPRIAKPPLLQLYKHTLMSTVKQKGVSVWPAAESLFKYLLN